jgi:uncharacterized protein YbjT (DUF2867 family)
MTTVNLPAIATAAAAPVAAAPAPPPRVPPSRALVFGASGYIGTHLVPYLVAQGWSVRAAARDRKVLQAREWPGVELVQADALAPATLPAALAGCDVAFYLVHSMAAGANFGALDLTAASHFAQAAAAAGVQRIVYLGGLIPSDADSEHLVSRRDTGVRLRAGPVPVIELRAGIIVGPGSAAYEVIRDLVFNLPLMVTPRWVQSRSSPIALPNLLVYLEQLARLPQADGGIFDAAGPEYLSYESLMRQFGEVVGRRPRIVPVPVLTPRLSSYWLALVTTVPASIARALIGGLKHDLPAADGPLRALVPQPLLTFRESVQAALQAEREHTVAARWTEGAFHLRARRHDYAYYAKRASGSAVAQATPRDVWQVVTQVGTRGDYFYANFLWRLRAWMDFCVGGPGLSHGRRHPDELRLGDVIEYWTVLGIEPERRLTLHFGLKAPGAGILEFEVEPVPSAGAEAQTRVTVTAYWHPAGLWGLLYWAAFAPAHLFIFRGMTRAIAQRAEHLAHAERLGSNSLHPR